MKLRPEALAILQVFKNKNCNADDFIHYSEFGDVLMPRVAEDKADGIDIGLQELIEGQFVIEQAAGLSITASGLNALS